MKKVMCGVIFENNEYSPIYAACETGDFFYPDAVMGDNRAISGITARAPEEIDFEDAVAEHEAGTYGDCIGFICDSDDVILILSDTTAKFSSTASTCEIDIYGDYDDDDETND